MSKVQLLENEDIFDFYGCQYLLTYPTIDLSDEERKLLEFRVREVHARYVHSVKERIRAEAVFCGIELEPGFSIKKAMEKVGEMVEHAMQSQAKNMLEKDEGFNLMGQIMQTHQMAGEDLSDINLGMFGVKEVEPEPQESVDPNWFAKDSESRRGKMWEDPLWHIISKVFVELESAKNIPDMMSTIDQLNDLQHNSFHILIDLQTGRMLEGQSKGGGHGDHCKAQANLKEVLDIKHNSKSPMEFANKMSKDIRSIMKAARSQA